MAIVEDGCPVGLLNRQQVLDRYTKPYFKELYGRRPCTLFANLTPLLVDMHTGVEELTAILTSEDQRYLADGFIITENGRYRGWARASSWCARSPSCGSRRPATRIR